MTSFGTGFFKTQNTIDFNFIIADFDFADNVTMFVVILISVIFFLITLIWAQLKDRKDIKAVIKLDNFNFLYFEYSKNLIG